MSDFPIDDLNITELDLVNLDFDKANGLLPVIAQDHVTGEVLMLGYGSRESLEATLRSGNLTFHSRSRDTLWMKGETSGHRLEVVSLHADCDRDAVLARVRRLGPTCHTGRRSCFDAAPTLRALGDSLEARRGDDPAASYTARLLADRNLRLKKLGEEAAELVVACADTNAERVREEAADVIYHTLVAALAEGVSVDQVLETLERRRA